MSEVCLVNTLINTLREERVLRKKGSFYHYVQLSFSYNSNKIEGSTLTSEQTELLYNENRVYPQENVLNYFDIVEMKNHFKVIDFILDRDREPLTEEYIKRVHKILKLNSQDEELGYPIGEYKNKPNIIVSGSENYKTSSVKNASGDINALLMEFSQLTLIKIEDIVDFHVRFERIHPFQDGNGRVGRVIMFKQCLEHGIMPFIIEDRFKANYLKGIKSWQTERGYLLDTCLYAQDIFSERFDSYQKIIKEID